MNIKALRNVHLYLGCFFAPLLVLFIVSGCWQTFNLHRASKQADGYKPPAIIKLISSVHIDQCWGDKKAGAQPSRAFQCLVILMSLGLLTTTSLGIAMAFKYVKPGIVWLCFMMGTSIPVLMIWIGNKQ